MPLVVRDGELDGKAIPKINWNKSLKPVRQQPGEIRGGEAEGSGQRPESHVVKTGKVAGRDSDGPAPSVLP